MWSNRGVDCEQCGHCALANQSTAASNPVGCALANQSTAASNPVGCALANQSTARRILWVVLRPTGAQCS